MRTVYIIYSWVGWAWAVLAAALLWWQLRRRAKGRTGKNRGFEVVQRDAQ